MHMHMRVCAFLVGWPGLVPEKKLPNTCHASPALAAGPGPAENQVVDVAGHTLMCPPCALVQDPVGIHVASIRTL